MSDENQCAQCGASLPAGAPEGLCPACLLKGGFETQTAAGAPGADFTPPPPEELAGYFPQLEIMELLGRGGMGAVYKARQRELDRMVALKILPAAAERDPAFAERFAREARALARLAHPNIVAVYDFGQTGGLFYFVMEYVDGLNLRQLLAAGGITPEEALAIVPQICEALQSAHDQGIVHRDIKPENILLDKKGRVKIADFGIAKIMGGEERDMTLTGAGEMVGTPAYMAPEQIEHPRDVDHRADIYSLGVVFYQMLTGELPLGKFAPPSARMRGVRIDVRLDDVVLRALEKEPELRYQQASEVKTQVETISGTEKVKSRHVEPAYAGFWRRVLALYIDYALVSIAVLPLLMASDYIAPGSVVVSVPFGLFTTTHVIESKTSERKNADGSTTAVDDRIVEVTALGKWRYFYREETSHSAGDETKSRHLIDPVSRQDVEASDADDVVLCVLMIYWILMESGPWQASVGKRIVGIQVVDRHGRRVSIARAAARNGSKLVSAVTLMLGFMAAGWTKRKQAFHDIMADCYVTVAPSPGVPLAEPKTPQPISPETAASVVSAASPQAGKPLAIAGAILQFGSIFGLTWSVVGVMSAFHSLSQKGVTDVQTLATAIGQVLEASTIALVIGLIGLVLLCISLTALHYRAKWFFWFLAIYSWPLLLLVPVGTPFAIFFLVYSLPRRDEFLGANGAEVNLKSHPAPTPPPQRFARLALGLLLLGFLGTPFLLALSPAQDQGFALAFGALSLLLALAFGLLDRRTRLGRGVALTVILLLAAMTLFFSLRFHQRRVEIEADINEEAHGIAGPGPQFHARTNESPKLRFLAWLDEVQTNPNWQAWRADGEIIKPADFHLPPRLGLCTPSNVEVSSAGTAKGNPRFICLWISDPGFDAQSVTEFKLLDEANQPLEVPTHDFAIGVSPPGPGTQNLGWIMASLCVGSMEKTPPMVRLELNYSAGSWQYWDDLAPDFHGSMALSNGVLVTDPGQDSDGKAFVQWTRDHSLDTGTEQFDFVAVTKDGRRLDTISHSESGTGSVKIERCTFDVPLDQVKTFQCRKRPINTILWPSIPLQKQSPIVAASTPPAM